MEFHRIVGILEQVTGENQHHGFFRLHKALLQQFLQSREGNGGGWLTANPFGADFSFGLGDFELTYLFAGATRRLKNFDRFFP